MTFDEGLELAMKNLNKKGMRAFIVFTFNNDGMMSESFSCTTMDKVTVERRLHDISTDELLPNRKKQ